MARFGQGLIQALTNPSYQQGMFDLGSAIGSAPAQRREKEARQQLLTQFMQGSPVQQGQILQQEGARTGNISLIDQGMQREKQAIQQGAAQGIQALITQIANPETSETLVKESRKTAINLARQNNVPEDRVRKALDAAEKQRLTAVYSSEVPKIQGLSVDAQKMISSGQTKEDFVAKHGSEYGFVFDEIQNEVTKTELALEEAKENARLSEYQYNDNQLKDLGLSENDIKTINSLPSGRAKNAAVVNFLTKKKAEAPNASLIRFYADSFVADIMTENDWDYDDEDEYKEAQALASQKARQLFLTYKGDPAGMADGVVNSKDEKEEDEEIDVDAAIQEINNLLLPSE